MMIVDEFFVALCTALTVTILVLFAFALLMTIDLKRRIKNEHSKC